MCMRDLLRIKFGIADSSLIEEIIQAGKIEVFPKGSMIVESGKKVPICRFCWRGLPEDI